MHYLSAAPRTFMHCSAQITCCPSPLRPYIVVVGTMRSLLGSPQNSKAASYHFQKHYFESSFVVLVTGEGSEQTENAWQCVCSSPSPYHLALHSCTNNKVMCSLLCTNLVVISKESKSSLHLQVSFQHCLLCVVTIFINKQ